MTKRIALFALMALVTVAHAGGTVITQPVGQKRVTGTCVGQVLVAINADGTVVCEADDGGGGGFDTAGTGLTSTGTTVNAIAGLGITANANDIAIDPTYTQRRVSGTCAAGSSIATVNQDGTVTCETDTDTTYTAGDGLLDTAGTLSVRTGTGITVTTDLVTLNMTAASCSAGSFVSAITATGGTTCTAEVGDISGITVGTGMTGTTSTGAASLALNLTGASCSSGSVMTALGATGTGTCTALGSHGGVTTATGVANTLAKYTSASALAVSQITDDGTTVLVGGNHFNAGRDVNGTTNNQNGIALKAASDGNNYFDLKSYTSMATTFRYGSGTGHGYDNTWMSLAHATGAATFNGASSFTSTLGVTGLLTATAGVTSPANLTTTSGGDVIVSDVLQVAGSSTLGDANTDFIKLNGNVTHDSAPGDDTYFAWDANADRIGFTKKAGLTGKLTFGSAVDFAIAQSNGTTIAAAGTFTDKLTINGTTGVVNTAGAITENGAAVLSGTIASNTIPKGSGGNLMDSKLTESGSTLTLADTAGYSLFVVGETTSGATDWGWSVSPFGDGNIYQDTKLGNAGTLVHRIGHNTESSAARTWLTVYGSNGATYLSGAGGVVMSGAAGVTVSGASGLYVSVGGATVEGTTSLNGTTNIGNAGSDAHALLGTLNANSTAGSEGQVLTIDGGVPKWSSGAVAFSSIEIAPGGLSLIGDNSTGATDTMTLTGSPTLTTSGADYQLFSSVLTASMDTTAGSISSYAGLFYNTSTETGGGNISTNHGIIVQANGADLNYAIETLRGDNQFNTFSTTGGKSTFFQSSTTLGRTLWVTNRGIDSAGDGAGIQFNLGTTTFGENAASIDVISENATHTGATADGTISIKTALNGTLTERLKITSAGATTLTGTFNATGAADFDGTVNIDGDISDAGGDVTIADGLNVDNAATFDSSVAVTGALNGYTQLTQAADQDVTNSAALVDSTNLQFSTTAAKIYAIDGFISGAGSSTAGDYKWALAVASGTMDCAGTQQSLTTADAIQNSTVIATTAAASTSTSVGTRADASMGIGIRFNVVCKVSASTTLKYQFAQAAATPATVARTQAGSYIRYKQLN